jgi:acyl transferase domain-containing protein
VLLAVCALWKLYSRLTAAGVYVGCMYSEYTQLQHSMGLQVSPSIVTSNGLTYLVGRVSYSFGLQGAIRLGSRK